MSDLLLQAMVERLEAQDFLLKEMSKDADNGQMEMLKKFDELKTDIALLKSEKQEHPEVKQLTLAVESMRILLSQKIPVESKRPVLRRKATWIFIGIWLLFMGMSWCWGYTFKAWSAAEKDGMKYKYMKSIPNPTLARFCRVADSLSAANRLPDSYTPPVKPAGEKERASRVVPPSKKQIN
jgi:hypothetical protein